MSASAKTTCGPLPPSSSITCLPAARLATEAPVSVEPTKPTPSTSACPATSSPTSAPGPVTRLATPAGKSASAMHSISATEITLVDEAGVQTNVLPAARVVARQDQLGGAGRRQDTPFEALQVLRCDPEILDALVDLAQRFRLERLALVEGQQLAELLSSLLDRPGDPVQALRALESFEPSHRGARLVGRLDRALRVGAGAFRDLGDDLAGGGAVRVEGRAAL